MNMVELEPNSSSDLTFNDDLSSQFDTLLVPSMDPLFFPNENHTFTSEQPFASDLDHNAEFQISFDDFTDDFLLSEPASQELNDLHRQSDSPSSGLEITDDADDVAEFLNSEQSSPESVTHSLDNSGDKVSSFKSPDSDRESSGGSISSQGSVLKTSSPERDVSSCGIGDGSVKLEDEGKNCDLKRKKQQNEGNGEARNAKYRKSLSMTVENSVEECGFSVGDEEDEKRKARLMRNRESAQLSRQRKKHYVEELEEKVRSMHSTITDLSSKVSFVMAENAALRQQLGATTGGMHPHPPMPPMTYPWVPYAPYVVKPQGSQVPLVPIPRLKPQQPQSAPKAKKSDNKKAEGKTKKVASISLLGLFFFIFLFGGLVPLVNIKFGDVGDNVSRMSTSANDRFYSRNGGKFWEVSGYRNISGGEEGMRFSSGNQSPSRLLYETGHGLEETMRQQDSLYRMNSDDFVHKGNASEAEPLVASLYVPRNDKLVKIDGNLIIHSVLASEKAMATDTAHTDKSTKENGLVVSNNWDSALAIPEVGRNRDEHTHPYSSPPEQRKALASGSAETLKNHMKSTATDGSMQQWFREGLAGPMLSSGMCTEVFQFDASPKPGAIVPASSPPPSSSVANVSAVHRQNDTSVNKGRNRRFLHKLPHSPAKSSGLNASEEHVMRNSQNESLHSNKSASSSMVVSVLVDPKEVGDGDVDGVMQPKSLSRIFVVVLMDSVKYVTYSCGLPRTSPHLVTA